MKDGRHQHLVQVAIGQKSKHWQTLLHLIFDAVAYIDDFVKRNKEAKDFSRVAIGLTSVNTCNTFKQMKTHKLPLHILTALWSLEVWKFGHHHHLSCFKCCFWFLRAALPSGVGVNQSLGGILNPQLPTTSRSLTHNPWPTASPSDRTDVVCIQCSAHSLKHTLAGNTQVLCFIQTHRARLCISSYSEKGAELN